MPMFNISTTYNYSCLISGKKVKFRAWTTKEEKNYLILRESSNLSNESLFNTLIAPCLEDNTIELDENERQYLLVKIREISIGETFPIKFICDKCKEVNEQDVELEKAVHFSGNSYGNIEEGDYIFNIGKPTEKALLRLNSEEAKASKIERAFINFVISTKEVTYKGSKNNTFNYQELYEFVEGLPNDVFKSLYEKFSKVTSSLSIHCEVNCINCDHEKKLTFKDIPNFLWQ